MVRGRGCRRARLRRRRSRTTSTVDGRRRPSSPARPAAARGRALTAADGTGAWRRYVVDRRRLRAASRCRRARRCAPSPSSCPRSSARRRAHEGRHSTRRRALHRARRRTHRARAHAAQRRALGRGPGRVGAWPGCGRSRARPRRRAGGRACPRSRPSATWPTSSAGRDWWSRTGPAVPAHALPAPGARGLDRGGRARGRARPGRARAVRRTRCRALAARAARAAGGDGAAGRRGGVCVVAPMARHCVTRGTRVRRCAVREPVLDSRRSMTFTERAVTMQYESHGSGGSRRRFRTRSRTHANHETFERARSRTRHTCPRAGS